MVGEGRFASFSTLSERQRQCLELRGRRLTLKEIGQELRLSPHTVDGHLEAAQRIIGASSRRESVDLFLTWRAGEQSTGEDLGLVSPTSPMPVVRRPDAMPDLLNDIQIVQPLSLDPGSSAQRRNDEQDEFKWPQFVRLALAIAILLVLALVIFDTLERLVPRFF